ncbi:hypothetical protein ACGYLM_07360 [Sulfitobacter sp. 1A10445]|uniref:hypothetical protein n=1 Tax=unclassified Sulfitobacter TaxID=196795 RepID=UPI003744ECE5
MKKIVAVIALAVVSGSAAFANEAECQWLDSDPLVKRLCECREIESDIERLACFERSSIIEFALKRQASARAEWLSRQPYGIQAMRDRTENDKK